MTHYYTQIQGWFDWQDIYRKKVFEANDGDVFVEVGCYKGKSTAFMAVEIMNSKKDISFYCVDTWTDLNIYKSFLKNISPVKDYVTVIRDNSLNVKIPCDFVFIDASHQYKDVKADIDHWKKYAKQLAGHDYTSCWPGVIKAVKESFQDYEVINNSWVA